MIKRDFSCRQIALDLGVSHTTISRELRRNRGQRGYRHKLAHRKSLARCHKKAHKMRGALRQIVLEKLRLKWSPEQISGWLLLHSIAQISVETIYRFLRENPRFKRHLRHKGKRYRKRATGRTGAISNRVDISQRPDIVEEKSRIGDWKLDTMIGKGDAVLVTMVDRASKFCKLRRAPRNDARSVAWAVVFSLKRHKQNVHTLTADNGAEFARHQGVAYQLDAKFYFAKPYHAWQRGLNEHTNGLIRQFLPKGTDFDNLSERYLRHIQNRLNNRPRKVLGYKTPKEALKLMTLNEDDGALGM